MGDCLPRPRSWADETVGMSTMRERNAYEIMAIFVQPQREPEAGDQVNAPFSRQRERLQSWIFIHYEFTVTAEFAGYFEWWFPYVDFAGRDSRIWYATLEKSNLITAPQICRLVAQSPSDGVRLLLHDFDWKAGIDKVPGDNYLLPDGARGILIFDSVTVGTVLRADYLVEII